MQTLLFVSFDPEIRAEFVSKLRQDISPFDLFLVNCQDEGGIDMVRQLKSFSTRKPTQGDTNLILLTEAQYLTTEAQNALLKILEDTPSMTKIVLTVPTTDQLLPTVISRCQIDEPNPEAVMESVMDADLVTRALEGSDSERLRLADNLEWDRWLKTWQQLLIAKINGDTIIDTGDLTAGEIKKYLLSLLTMSKMKEDHVNFKFLAQVALLSCPKIRS